MRTPYHIDRELCTVFRRHVELSKFIDLRSKGKNKASDAELFLARMETNICQDRRERLIHERELAVERDKPKVGNGSIEAT